MQTIVFGIANAFGTGKVGALMNKKYYFHFLNLVLLLLLEIPNAQARLVQILHTNDTHSFLNNATHNTERGGAERLKTLIDFYKEKMAEKAIKTVVMDGGDFMEGNIYYMSQSGRKTFNIHNEMGYDVGVLGNHDYLMGTNELNKLLGEFSLKFNLLAANLEIAKEHRHIKEKIQAFHELEIDGIKIAVLGLTTNEILYKWKFEKGLVTDPFKSAQKYEKLLKQRGNDYIIALTHLGLFNDMRLLTRTRHIDLVVGGHSHDVLFKEKYYKNRSGKQIPIVQAGAHTEYLGRLLIDVEKGAPLKVIEYELIAVNNIGNDLPMKNLVAEADSELDILYGKDWLASRVGESDLKPGDDKGMNKWGFFVADALKEKAQADISIHAPPMNGANYPVGSISRRDLFNSFPRIFDVKEKYGWNIYTTTIRGVWLRLTIQALGLFGQPLIFAGVDVDYVRTPIGIKIRKMRVNGKKVNPFKNYKVAFTEGIVKGAQGVDDRSVAILQNPTDTKFKIWHTLEEKLFKDKVEDLNEVPAHHTLINY